MDAEQLCGTIIDRVAALFEEGGPGKGKGKAGRGRR
jgi:hypothetical protein